MRWKQIRKIMLKKTQRVENMFLVIPLDFCLPPMFILCMGTMKSSETNKQKQKVNMLKHEAIALECKEQNVKFRKWADKGQWKTFHSSHYDWWAFPIDKPSSSYGTKYKLGEIQLAKLRDNPHFIQHLRSNAILVCRSWGWDLQAGKQIKDATPDQRWQRWPIRLSKMCRSLQIFKQDDLFRNSLKLGIDLLKEYKKFTYGGKDLTPYFYEKWQALNNPHHEKPEHEAKEVNGRIDPIKQEENRKDD